MKEVVRADLEHLRPAITEGLWGHSRICCSLLNLHPMFICASAENCFTSLQELPTFEDIREDHRVKMPDMRSYQHQ